MKNYLNVKIIYSQRSTLRRTPEVDSAYSLNLRYAKYWCNSFFKPLSKNEFKKKYEKIEKKVDEGKSGPLCHPVKSRSTSDWLPTHLDVMEPGSGMVGFSDR